MMSNFVITFKVIAPQNVVRLPERLNKKGTTLSIKACNMAILNTTLYNM